MFLPFLVCYVPFYKTYDVSSRSVSYIVRELLFFWLINVKYKADDHDFKELKKTPKHTLLFKTKHQNAY